MNGTDFYDKVAAHPDLEIIALRGGNLLVKHLSTQGVFEVEPVAVLREEWATLEEVLTEKREPEILAGFARIVGYYGRFKLTPGSHLNSWNASKLGELKARRRGNYEVECADDLHGKSEWDKVRQVRGADGEPPGAGD